MLTFLKKGLFGRKQKYRRSIEYKLASLTFAAGALPSVLLIIVLTWSSVSDSLLLFIALLLVITNFFFVLSVWRESNYQFRSVHSLLDAIVQGDYSLRGASSGASGAFKELVDTINSLALTLHYQRLRSEESIILVKKIVDHIDVAIISYDQNYRMHLINPEAMSLFGLSSEFENNLVPDQLINVEIDPGEPRVVGLHSATGFGKFRVYQERFISEGKVHNLIFVTDLSKILRIEERKAWKNLIRVLGHEINNSVTPISSYSGVLIKQVNARVVDLSLRSEIVDGLSIIRNRAKSIANFVESYKDISRLPSPNYRMVNASDLILGVVRLFPSESIFTEGGSYEVRVDSQQLEHALINLIKNGVEANNIRTARVEVEQGAIGRVSITWLESDKGLEIYITDCGDGILNPENLFTPFYSTKDGGTGIGLVLSQQIIEAHNGTITLRNRADSHGCIVTITLPVL